MEVQIRWFGQMQRRNSGCLGQKVIGSVLHNERKRKKGLRGVEDVTAENVTLV